MLGLVLSIASGIGSLVCMIIVLMKLFSQEGTLKGILGLFCALYAYAWGWINQKEHNLMDVMFIWTISIMLGMVARLLLDTSSLSFQ
jgi:hypothetical protein